MSYMMSKELGQAVLNYLGTQPYVQVAQMVEGMQNMIEVDDQDFAMFISKKQGNTPGPVLVPEQHPEQDEASGD